MLPVTMAPSGCTSRSTAARSRCPSGELLIKAAQDARHLHPALLLARAHEAGRHVPHVPRRDRRRARPPALPAPRPSPTGWSCTPRTRTSRKAQDGVLEFLLINHPLDCPVCDRGGECPLQDQTLAFGPGESRFVEEKRHFAKPIPISDLVLLDRERCIQCGRCTRFADEIAGDPLIDFGERGESHAGPHLPRRPVHVVLLGQHRADLPGRRAHRAAVPVQGPAVGPRRPRRRRASRARCSAGARCSRRRTGSSGCSASTPSPSTTAGSATRAATATSGCTPTTACARPMVRRDGRLTETSWPEALDAAAEGLRKRHRRARCRLGRGASAARHGTNEDAYAWARFAKGVIGTDNVDAQLGDGLPAEVVLGLPRAPRSPTATPRPRSCCSDPTSRKSCRSSTSACAAPPTSSASRSIDVAAHRTTASRRTRARSCATCRGVPARRPAEALDTVTELTAGRAGRRRRRARPAVARGAGRRHRPCGLACSRRSPTSASSRRCAAATCTARSTSASRPGFLPGRVTLDAGRDHFTGRVGQRPGRHGPRHHRDPRRPPPTARSTRSCSSAPTRSPTSPTACWRSRALDERRLPRVASTRS